ncbi:MAG TPA: glutathione S-transferase family protein [Afifellaceae bacterium]|nr:glutathione S-transferase family protein [Afifellaceae bacterium]
MTDRLGDGLILYHGWTSSASRKVRFALAEKGLPYDSRPVDIRRNEHHTPEYRRINPRGVVPALIHDGVALIESTFICEYIDDAFPDPPLRPAEPLARYRMRMWCRDVDERYLPAVQKHNWQATIHPIARAWSDAELEERLARIPSPERRQLWYRMAREPFTEAELEGAMEVLRGLIREMEAALADRQWLTGEALTLADIAVTPYVKRIEELEPRQLDGGVNPRAAGWWRRITARPGYRAANIGGYLEQAAPDYRVPSA